MLKAFVRFYFTRTHADWLELRRVCMAALPKKEKAGSIEENGR